MIAKFKIGFLKKELNRHNSYFRSRPQFFVSFLKGRPTYLVMPYSRILISVDNHENSLTVARKGIELARKLDAKAALLFVLDKAKAMGNIEANILPQQAMIVLKKEAQQTLDQLSEMYDYKNIVKFMPEGHPAEDIIKTALNWEADLIIVGTHGNKGLAKLLSSHVSDYVLHHAKVPVMLIPPKEL